MRFFSKILKIGTFTKTWIKFSVFQIFSPNFFYKIWMECRYEKCPKTSKLLACQTCQNKKKHPVDVNKISEKKNSKQRKSEKWKEERSRKGSVM